MTIDEAIKHCEEVAEEQEKLCKANDDFNFSQPKWRECAKEHRQLAEWLKDYKRLLEQEPKTDVIDKIRTEIEEHAYLVRYNHNSIEKGMTVTGINQVIDKYRK